jgi:hypothetical protein
MADENKAAEPAEEPREVEVTMHIRTYWRDADGNPHLRCTGMEVWPLPAEASTAIAAYLQACAQHWLNAFGFTETQPMEQTAAPPGTRLN